MTIIPNSDPHALTRIRPARRLAGVSAVLLAWLLATTAAAQGSASGEYGALALGGSVEGTLAPVHGDEIVVYHTYVVSIPAASGPVTVSVEGFGNDIDLALKLGAPIVDYGDVDFLDVSDDPDPSHTIAAPAAGPLYIDVLNLLPVPARYRLSVVAAAAPPAPTQTSPGSTTPNEPTAPLNPLAGPSDPLLGTFAGDGLEVRVEGGAGRYQGELTLAGQTYTFTASGSGGRLEGSFVSGGSSFPFTAVLALDTLTLTSGGAAYVTLRVPEAPTGPVNPLGAPARSPDGTSASAPHDPVLARGSAATLTQDNALAFLEALEFSLWHVGLSQGISDVEQRQLLEAIAANYASLPPADQAVLAQAREVWTRVQANWSSASEQDRSEFVLGVFVLAFGEETVQQAIGGAAPRGGGAGAGAADLGSACGTIDECMSRYAPEAYSDTINVQGCWAAAGCSSYDPVDNSFTFESYD